MAKKITGHGLAYSDVLIRPSLSDIRSRHSENLKTTTIIARGLTPIQLPIISANMDTVTEHRMAITMALHGGLGIIHRFMTSEQQAAEVAIVKDLVRVIEDDPPLVSSRATIAEVMELQQKRNRGYVIVYEQNMFDGRFVGIATSRDFPSASPTSSIAKVMTPKNKMITVSKGTNPQKAADMMNAHRIQKIPVVDSKGNLVGVYTLKDLSYELQYPQASLDKKGRLMVGAAIGVQPRDIERTHLLIEAGVDVLVLDIAHGGLTYTSEMLHRLKNKEGIKVPIIAGNVATAEGARYIYDSGADGVKVGVGPGFVCETRNVAGVGVPQVTAVMEVAGALAKKRNTIPIMADGGIREPGDLPKAIVAGASCVMIGSLFAGTKESPGDPTLQGGVLKKIVQGMASASAFQKRKSIGGTTTNGDRYTPEGRTIVTPYKGTVTKTLYNFDGGLRSSMSYVGAHTISEMQQKGQFVTVSNAGATENTRDLKS
jgi:IMP dehydrogenase